MITMTHSSEPNLIDILKRAGIAIIFGVLTFAVSSFLLATGCVEAQCAASVASSSAIAGGVAFILAAVVAFLPVIAAFRSEAYLASLNDHRLHAEALHEHELKRIERDRLEGLNQAEIVREEAKTQLVAELARGVANGTVHPQLFVSVARALDGGAATKLATTETLTIQAPINHWEYRLMNIGGLDSPIKGVGMKSGYLTCSLRSLKVAADLALAGKAPSRGEFEKAGLKSAEEIQEGQLFLKERGLLDPDFSQYRWHPRINAPKLSKWIGGTIDTVQQRGGEALYRQAARAAKPKPDAVEIIDG